MDKTDWQNKGQGHRQRLRERFAQRGLAGFSDSEVVELLLTLATPRRDCKEAARGLLDRFGSLAGVLEASQPELEQVRGIGARNTFALHLIHQVARRYLQQRLTGKRYATSSREVADYLTHALRGLKREVLLVLLLDAGHAILTSVIVSEGSLTSNTVHPREVIRLALEHHAAAVVVAHNHPSGRLQPSAADHHLTRHLYLALGFCGIQLLDHCIVGNGETPFSFADQGLMAEIRSRCQPVLSGN